MVGGDRITVFIRAFLINKQLNGRGWRINASTLAKNILSYINKPLILKRFANGRVDHREWDSSLSASQNLHDQLRYSIGQIKKLLFDQTSQDYYADIEITNKDAEDWIRAQRSHKIPIAVSPQIIYDRRKEPDPHNITNWFGSHLAIVDTGAYGPSAVATNLCGDEGCPIDIQKGLDASFVAEFSIPAALDAAIFDTSQATNDAVNQYSMSMIEVRPDGQAQPGQSQQQQNNMLTPSNISKTPVTPPVPENQTFGHEERREQQEQPKQTTEQERNIDYKQLSEQYKTELENVKGKLVDYDGLRSQVNEQGKQLAKNDAESKERAIKEAIPIFLDEFIDKNDNINWEAVDAEVKDCIKRGWTAADVEKMYRPAVKAWEAKRNASANANNNNNNASGKPCNCGTTAANASIYTVPTTEVEGQDSVQKPWFVDAARFMGSTEHNFSKRPWRVL